MPRLCIEGGGSVRAIDVTSARRVKARKAHKSLCVILYIGSESVVKPDRDSP
jgi:hypothetical protein